MVDKNLLFIEREDELKLKILESRFAITDMDEYMKRFSSRLKKRGINAGISVSLKNFISTDYYDTRNYDLRKSSLVYRIRKLDNTYIANIKEDSSSDSIIQNRMEYTVTLPDEAAETASVSYFKGTQIWKRLKDITGRKKLYKKFSTVFTRYNYDIVVDKGSSILLSIDDGVITADDLSERIFEAEMELKSGSSNQMLTIAALLSEVIPMDFEPKSKFVRGLILSGALQLPSKPISDNAKLNPSDDKSLINAVTKVLNNSLIVSENYAKEYINNVTDPESLHKLRVSLRKIRTVIFFLKPLIQKNSYNYITGLLRNTAAEMSLIREIDVLIVALNEACLPDDELLKNEFNEAVNIAAGYRKSLEQKLYSFLSEGKLTTIFLNLHSFIYGMDFLQEDFFEYTDMRMKELQLKINNLIKETILTRDKYHKLRVYFKRVRYITEFFLPGDKSEKTPFYLFSKKAQDVLGKLNDAYVNLDLTKELFSAVDIAEYTRDMFERSIKEAADGYLLLKEEYKEIFNETEQGI